MCREPCRTNVWIILSYEHRRHKICVCSYCCDAAVIVSIMLFRWNECAVNSVFSVNSRAAPRTQALHYTMQRPRDRRHTVQCSACPLVSALWLGNFRGSSLWLGNFRGWSVLKAFCGPLDSHGQVGNAYETGAALYCAAPRRWALHSILQHLSVGRCSAVNYQTTEIDAILASCSTDITCYNINKITVDCTYWTKTTNNFNITSFRTIQHYY